jgi:hypothetical protein
MLMGESGNFAIKVVFMLAANSGPEVVAGNQEISIEEDANGVVDGCTPGNQL